ncbi:hypothetical protein OSB04_001534 [Centaurea solstitialis]|uniref:Uncharacterized protein n=1 Tax=Centaurea solstitialis TaxID=347529 RepID=A0AA38UA36_9ASTR|nr:hypothetical protein OSB04_001534 [Centaurea solstitialis]
MSTKSSAIDIYEKQKEVQLIESDPLLHLKDLANFEMLATNLQGQNVFWHATSLARGSCKIDVDALTCLTTTSLYHVSHPYLSAASLKNLVVLHLERAIIPTPVPFPLLEKLTLCHLSTNGQPLCVHAPKLSALTISGWSFDGSKLRTPNLISSSMKSFGSHLSKPTMVFDS